jgi:hypothetical protein
LPHPSAACKILVNLFTEKGQPFRTEWLTFLAIMVKVI